MVVVVSGVVVGVLFYVRCFGVWVLPVVLVWCMLCLYLVLVVVGVGLLWGLAVEFVFSTVTVINSVVAGTFCACYVLIWLFVYLV